ncbi:hypothetical protein KMZ32_06410 [Phycicoccus sp. MAQZ13P-2]|uniref:glutamine amidotransferase-related protein n=1 Tax=Phycicoccus mangrovi TaxID=2840470 RepID=UPI001BFFE0EF|nr:hypothetical protein [Phycicoccus mangrovi]MBT9256307.1 hypothetical protein [Phycicoccus mangrovi]MBT9273702.1 hypothetical protein [Phycicoccus mangrovi]
MDALRPRLAAEYEVESTWIPTDAIVDLRRLDGVWLVPGAPYRDDRAVIAALTAVRAADIPFLGTCGGMQYAVMEFMQTELGAAATHAESDGEGDDNAVVPLACSLYGEIRQISPLPGSRFASWCPEPFDGVHYCNYAPSEESVAQLQAAGVQVSATAPDAGAEVLEFPTHPFYVTSMFQPHIGTLSGAPTHGLIRAFMDAIVRN